jgi:hypothetical protein
MPIIVLLTTIVFTQPTFAQPTKIVHTETVKVGPYTVQVGFSRWPVQADKSLDFTFAPEGGIADKTGVITMLPPANGKKVDVEGTSLESTSSLSRYARDRNIWGLDVISLPEEGQWKFQFEIDGPQGKGTGSLDVMLLPRPAFLPPLINWSLGLLPCIGIIALVSVAWRRAKTGKHPEPGHGLKQPKRFI